MRIIFSGYEIEKLERFDPASGAILSETGEFRISPASHYVTTRRRLDETIEKSREELWHRVEVLKGEEKFLEAKRLEQRTLFDIEMMQEIGYCSGIENYSR